MKNQYFITHQEGEGDDAQYDAVFSNDDGDTHRNISRELNYSNTLQVVKKNALKSGFSSYEINGQIFTQTK